MREPLLCWWPRRIQRPGERIRWGYCAARKFRAPTSRRPELILVRWRRPALLECLQRDVEAAHPVTLVLLLASPGLPHR
eukprot:3854518-Alexandrium_andersonii.AAC.1